MEEIRTPGFILVHRSILQAFYYKEPDFFHLWGHILMKANWKEKSILFKGKKFPIKRGQFVTSRKQLAEETGIQESKVERILKTFESEQQIEQQAFNVFRLITVLNYDEYQNVNSEMNTERTAREQRVNTTKEEEQDKRIFKRVLTSKTQLDQWLKMENRCLTNGWLWHEDYGNFQLAIEIEGSPDAEGAFDKWWKIYPRHTGKQDALEHFRARCREGLFDEICQGTYGYGQYINQQLSSRGISFKEYMEFIKHPKTFLQKERWKEKIGYMYQPRL